MKNSQYDIIEAEEGFGKCLVLTSVCHEGLEDFVRKENISILRLSESMGWKANNIEFLDKLHSTSLRGVEIYSWRVKDITPLSFLPNLEFIGLQCEFTQAPVFSDFENLSHLQLLWRPKAKSVFACEKIEKLNIVNFPEVDLSSLNMMSNLTTLQLTFKKLESLDGIKHLKTLIELDIADCSKLKNLSALENLANLEILRINSCKSIDEIPDLSKLFALKDFALDNCGNVKSLEALKYCRNIKTISFTGNTRIEDGNLDFFLGLERLIDAKFMDHKHYSIPRDKITYKTQL